MCCRLQSHVDTNPSNSQSSHQAVDSADLEGLQLETALAAHAAGGSAAAVFATKFVVGPTAGAGGARQSARTAFFKPEFGQVGPSALVPGPASGHPGFLVAFNDGPATNGGPLLSYYPDPASANDAVPVPMPPTARAPCTAALVIPAAGDAGRARVVLGLADGSMMMVSGFETDAPTCADFVHQPRHTSDGGSGSGGAAGGGGIFGMVSGFMGYGASSQQAATSTAAMQSDGGPTTSQLGCGSVRALRHFTTGHH